MRRLLEELPPEERPALVCGDNAFGFTDWTTQLGKWRRPNQVSLLCASTFRFTKSP